MRVIEEGPDDCQSPRRVPEVVARQNLRHEELGHVYLRLFEPELGGRDSGENRGEHEKRRDRGHDLGHSDSLDDHV